MISAISDWWGFRPPTSPDSIEDGFQALAVRLGIEWDGTSERLRSAVHEALSTRAGKFLLVFDDATPDLARRLAAELERWPLAIKLATGYLRSCGYTLADVDHYLEALKVRSLGDDLSVPLGTHAPLSLPSISVCRFCTGPTPREIVGLVTEMLMRASYLSGRRVPIQLLAAPLALGADNLPAFDNISEPDGPVVLQNPQLPEAVRALCRISFARRDERLAWRASDLIPTADHTIAVNAVLQEVVRTRLEEGAAQDEWKDELRRRGRSRCGRGPRAYEVAMLDGGPRRVVDTALAAMLQDGAARPTSARSGPARRRRGTGFSGMC